ncbi:nonribosomal peptide synthase [Zopfia rhizophila CBS 207.26]|uniref:Nonribosomal peptide synthase n=1 Tax=Zopfia rhizophila CBS 207.26 TaxID=1314779 RepID=A0A6A6E564_9PEZI|nr:nonribosomal peptide synthase [Zopfia rhizophila CBS 207.26]
MSADVYQRAIPTTEHASSEEEPTTKLEGSLRSIWARVLNLPEKQISMDRSFLSLGGDSISAMQVMGHCRKKGIGLAVQEILRSKSIPELAKAVKGIHISTDDVVEEVEKPFSLSPIQYLWYQLPNQGHGHFNQSFYLQIKRKTPEGEFRLAIEKLVSRHSMLRARFRHSAEDGWEQRVTEDVRNSYRFRHQTVSTKGEIDNAIEDCQKCLNPVQGPLFAADLFEFGHEQHAFLVGHHLVIDLVSWRLLLEELEEILNGGTLLPPALPFQKWCQLQQEHAKTLQLSKVLPPAEIPALDFSYWGISHQDNTYGNACHESFDLDSTLTSLFLNHCHNALGTEPVEVLLASMIHSWAEVFTDRELPAFFYEGHGREPWDSSIDVSRTVGWFTTVYPIFIRASEDPIDTVRRVKDFRRQIPANGRLYFARRCLTADGQETFKNHWPMEISFNYLGQYQQLERSDALLQSLESMAGETREAGGTADVGHDAPRFALFEISAIIFKSRLRFAFTFNRHMHHQQCIRQWISNCQSALTRMTEELATRLPEPTLSDFPLLSLTEDRLQSMLHRLAKIGVSGAEVEDAYPCSNMQEGLLLSQTKDIGFYAAVVVHEIKLSSGQPEWQKVADAWRRVARRHAALRTIFLENVSGDDGLYDQIVLKNAEANVVHFDCKDEQDALGIFDKQRLVSYDNGRSPPHRFTICSTAAGRVFSCLEISHAIMDGHSMSLFFRDLRQAYHGSLREDGPLYSNYVTYLKSQPQDVSLEYWKSYLNGSEVCSFPVLNDGLTVARELRSIRLDFGNLSVLDLQTFCTDHGITLSNIFHSAWALTLSCYVGSNDVTFGYLTSARDAQGIPGVEDMVGPLINTLVCRVKFLDGSKCLLDVLQEVQQDYMNTLPHRHTSLAEVQHAMELSGASLFNTALSYRKLPPDAGTEGSGLKFVELAPIYDPTEYPVSLNIEVSEEAAMVDLDYWTDHLSDGQAANVASAFVRGLENIVFNAQKSLSALDHLSGKQWQQILNWNAMPEALNECVHYRFAQWVKTQPDAPAIRGFDGNYTYAELDSVAERLAHYLVELGVGPEVFVPTCFDKSSFTVIAMLAVLKAGGAAVPLDANHPKPALESRIEDTEAQVVLTSAARSELFEDVVPDVVVVDSILLDDLQDLDAGPACTSVEPHNPAFVIFTSGSTGRPKGVVLEHVAMVTSANAHGTNLGIGPGSRFLQFASYTFDNSLEEMFTTLQRGGCVCVPSEEQRLNHLANAIAELDANFMDLTPTVAGLLNPTDVPTIKGMALGGEALTKAVVDQWSKYVHLHGQYGPSEASINSAWKDFQNGGEPTNIGRAIGSVSWIVDPENRNRLVPIGCKGELLIEGPILSRGYLKDPEKTALAFISAPEWAQVGGVTPRRFYCTGDLVHYTSSGEMMYMGRKDSQVKLNGQRIELGEIEHHIKLNLPAEAQSAVELVAASGKKHTKALAAFLCLVDEAAGPVTDGKAEIMSMTDSVRSIAKTVEVALSNALPAYYVPSMFLPISSMPMTTSGKLDRKVLRQLAQAIGEDQIQAYRLAGKSGRAPSGPVEITLAKLWEAILNLDPDSVGVDDSFFRMGGDSIGAMRLVTTSRKEGIVLTVANIFAHPKLSEMVATAVLLSSEDMSAELEPDTVPFELLPEDSRRRIIDFAASECDVFPDSIEDIYPCSRLQEGLIALSTKEPGAYVAETVYRLPADTNIDRFRQAWNKVVESEAILRTRIIYTEDQGFLQVVVRDSIQWHQIADLQDIKETDRHLPAKHGGALTRYAIVGEGTNSPFCVWTAHHSVYDGWSLPSLLCKVESCYRQTALESLTSVPYSRFIKYLASIDQKQSDDFWTSTFEDITAPQFPQLPNPAYQVQASSQLVHDVQISRRSGTEVTMPSMIRAAWGLLLATYSGSDDVLWGETNSGREVPVVGIEDIVGATIATSPMRLRLNRQATVQEYLHDVQRISSASLPFQFAGLQHIRKLSSDTAAACEFQSLLAIVAGDSMKDPEGGLWDLQSTGTVGTNFFNYGLILNCTVTRDGVNIEAHYDDKVIQTWLVERILQQFDFILQGFNSAETLQQTLGELHLLNPRDEGIVSEWNSRPVNVINKCVHNVIFQEQVILRPSGTALDAWDTSTMTYRELDERATRLASRLISLGVKPQTFIPLCFDKSGWTVVAMLAVMKAGAAFVPLDFEAPLLRLREIVNDVDAKLILCAPQYQDLCQSIPCKPLVVDYDSTERQPGRLYTLPYVQSDTPAYVIFTSGSTGKPKGAVINHCSYVSSSAAFAPAMGISNTSRVLQFASYTFDACLIEILSTLMLGGCICVPDQAARTNDLPGVINKMNVNWTTLTPSVVRTMQPSQVPQLKTLVLVGEAMSQQDLLTWADRVTLVNGYGPTECSAIATVKVMTTTTKPSNLGRTVTARGWVVSKDNHHVLVPLGAVGELLLEGGGVGAGYLKNPEKTAQAFISQPKWAANEDKKDESAAERFYKTGDLVKYNDDGTMIYLGRKDTQTKVRGQRLELSEVEHHLIDDPLVQNALAAVPSSGPCAKRLVGVVSLQELAVSQDYTSREPLQILPSETASFNIGTIRDRLCERLPSYMVPSLWVAVSEFPLMPSGKMDRKRVVQWLEKMDSEAYRKISTLGLENPKDEVNDVESKLQAIFAHVLNLPTEDIRLNQSFLHLGGDSIAAMQVSSQCRAQGFAITVQDIIRSRSIAQLASRISITDHEDSNAPRVQEYDLPFDLTPIQKIFFESVGDVYNHFNQSVVLRLGRQFEPPEIETAINSLVTTHPLLRARYSKDESKTWRQRIEKETKKSFRFRHHRVSSGTNENIRPVVDESQATLDITNGPTFSVDLFEINDSFSQAIALVAHHLVIDVVSWGIVLEDLQNLLNGINPPPQSFPFHIWSQQQAEQARQETASKVLPVAGIPLADLEYWGMNNKANINADVITEDIELSPKDSMLLLGAHDALETEPLDVFIAALLESFRRVFSDRSTVTIHNEGHGREPFNAKQDLSRTIGWFTTLTPIHLPVPPEEPTDIISTIKWVKDLRERVPDKGRPYFAHRVLTEKGQERFAGHWPAEVTFNYLGRMQNLERKDALLQKMDGISTSDIGDDVPRFSLFEITALVAQGIIKLSFSFNLHMKRQPEIKRWISECRQCLVDAVEQLLQLRPEPTLSSFKLLPLSYNGMSKLSAALPPGTTIDAIEDIYPASPMQQGLLLSQLKHPEFYAYHCIFEVQSTDPDRPVNARRIAEAWQIVVHRHPTLRTVFIESLSKTGIMDQIVFKDRPGRVSWILDCDDEDVAHTLRTQTPVDYREFNPPHRLMVCKTKTDKVWVKLEMSHAICDGSSIPNLLRDLARAYEGKLSRSDSGPLYSDFIAHILSSSRDADINYWKAYLSGIEPCHFPSLHDGKPGPHELGSYEVHLKDAAGIQSFCKRNGVTLSNVLQLGWALLLHCYVGTSDVSFGVVASGRDIPIRNIEEAAGCFVNMLICRTNFTDETRIHQLLEQLQIDSVNAMAHQSCSLADVQHELQLPSLFNTVFTFQRRQLSRDPEKTALVYENVEAADPGEYHITVNADVSEEGVTVDFGFWKDKVSPTQAQNMVEAFERIIANIVASQDKYLTVGDLDFITSGSLHQIMEWNDELPPPIRRCVHDLFQEQVLLRPRSAKAIEGWDGHFTYQQLNDVTNRLAVHLNTIGITTETFVPILFEKSTWAIVSIVAIMKAGGAYVPLDPKHPPSRLRQLIGDVGAKVVLCSKNYHPRAKEVATTAFIIDRQSIDQLPQTGAKPQSNVTPDHAAYCLFTSGTTGVPKGTIIPHQSFCTSSSAFTRLMNMDATSRTFQFASYTFDASCAEILGALTVGACICVPSEDERMNDPAGAIRRMKATWSFLTPSVLGTMKPEWVSCLKTLVVGGEVVPGPVITKWSSSTCLINAYGPTETTVFAVLSVKSTLGGELVDTDAGTIGIPSGCRLWVVHPRNHDKLMPIGSVGELIIEGYTAAHGYLGDEVKTAKVFIKDPAWAATLPSKDGDFRTTRMYKSGDLVRYNSNGPISYIGRKDTQIKLNGQRIELGEIEYHVKSKYPEDVQSAVELVAPASRNSSKALAVFFSQEGGQRTGSGAAIQPVSSELPAADELLLPMDESLRELCKSIENSLAGVLPSYMIPSIFIPVTKMPWTTASKLDRNRLRTLVQNLSKEAMTPYRLTSAVNKKKPITEAEKKLQKLVCSVLNLPPTAVGVDDSFIRIGGDSVAAMRLVAAAQAERIELSVIDIFKQPKLSDLAAKCSPAKEDSKTEQIIEPFQLLQRPLSSSQLLDELAEQCRVSKDQIQDAYPVSPLQEAFVTLSIKQAGAYVAQHILALSSTVDMKKFKAAWQKAVQEIDLLRTRIVQAKSGAFLQAVLVEDPINWHGTSTLQEAGREATQVPAHIGGPLAAYTIVRVDMNERYFVWTLHHALYDGWSIPFMLQRVEEIYRDGSSDIPRTPYRQFIKYLMDTNSEASTRFWKDNLAGAAPYQFPQRPHSTSDEAPNGQTLNHTVRLVPRRHSDITPSTVIRAAWALLLAAYTGSDDVIFGETLTGRDISVSGVTEMCGPTLTTVATRVQVNHGSKVLDLLHSIARTSTDRILYQHVGLADIKRIDSDTAVACDFQNLLAIQTGGQQPTESMWKFHSNGIQSNYFTYPLVIECKVGQSTIDIAAYHDENVISNWQVQRILYQLDSILGQLNSVNNVRDIKVFSEQDMELLQGWNDHEPVIVDDTIHSLFLKQASLRPYAPAVSAFDGDFTYSELRDLASRLAQQLIKLGAGPEKLIPLCVNKSRWAVVAIMGILLSGAAYVPLSPEHPSSRHRQIIQDCNATVLLCSPGYESRFTGAVNKVLSISESSIRQFPPRHRDIPVHARSNNVCYVLYTSGSTGVPKGVVIEHQAIASSSAAICKALYMKSSSRVFQFGSFVFDASVMEILTALTCGATICIPSEQERTGDITSAINKLKATWTCLTPSVANVIESPEAVPSLHTLAAGAEAMTPETIEKWGSGLHLLNAYGPTEGAIVAVANDQVSSQRDPSNIGNMLESGRAWILNPDDPHQLSPVGAVGELCIEGPLLARGYLNNRAKTAEAFIENPAFMKSFTKTLAVQTRIYRTGDLVQYAPDGSIRYVGRKDNQVKLAGQRMELGEIEHHLQANPRVRHAVVLMPKSGPGKRKLTTVLALHRIPKDVSIAQQAWNTPLADAEALREMNDIRNRLSDLVPSYMVPAVWVVVQDIPTLASAKLDRKQVGVWFEEMDDDTYCQILDIESSSELDVPATKTSKVLQNIWAKVLNLPIEKTRLNASWLSLGGDSITAMQLLARCRKEGINLTLNQVLRSKSIAQLADSIGSGAGASDHGKEQPDKPFDLSPIQQLYFKSIGDEKDSHFNQSFTLRLSRHIELASLKSSLDAIAKCHSMLRARFFKNETGTWHQMIPSNAADAYQFQVHDVASVKAIPDIISKTQKGLNIVHGPVFAVDLFNSRSGGQILFLAAHHLVIDMVSWRVILGDLEEALDSGSFESLQSPLSFQIWCQKQAEHAQQHSAIEVNNKAQFSIQPADLLFWGMDSRRNLYGDVERDSFLMDEDSSELALNDHRILRTEAVDLFVAAIVHSFSRVFINRQTPTIFNETHGREPWESSNIDLSRTVGWFTTMYPIHVPIGEDEDDVIQTVRKVKDSRRKVSDNGRPYFAHRFLTENGQEQYADHMPMELLFNYLGKMQQLEKDESLFQSMEFNEDDEAKMTDFGAKTARPALFEVTAAVVHGRVQFSFMYNRLLKNQKGIRRWIAECQRTLEEIVGSLAKIENPQPTLTDFPLLPLESYDRLDKVIKAFPSAGILSYDQVEDVYPCAAMQEGMILSQIKDPDSYLSFSAFEVKPKSGSVDVRRLSASWQKVVDRHPALRTVFVDSVCCGGVFDQIVVKNPDSGVLTYTCTDAELMDKLRSIKYNRLNGKRRPRLPHQFTIIQTNSGRVIVKMEINHAVIDGGSHAIIRRDLENAYEGRLPEEEGLRYSDYIKYLRSLPPRAAVKFWKDQLRGLQPCYFPVSPQHSSKQRQLHSVYMDFDRYSDLQKLGERSSVTFSNIMLAAWAIVLRTYTGSSDVCYGYLTSGRNIPIDGIQNAVGAFINMLVSRVGLTRSTSLLEVFQKVQNDFIESLPHQHCSLAQFQHDLGLSGKALFNTAVSIQNNVSASDDIPEPNVTFEHLDAFDPSEFAITVNIESSRNDEAVLFTYWTDSISDDEARNISSTMADILTQILIDPNQTISELDEAISEKPRQEVESPAPPSVMPTPRLEVPDLGLPLHPPNAEGPSVPAAMPLGAPDWGSLIRSIVNEVVPEIVDRMLSKHKLAPAPAGATVNNVTTQMVGMLSRKASQSLRARPTVETGSIRSRRLSVASDTESRINIAADMVAAAGVMATEALKSVPPDFVEKKLLTLWSELLDMVEDSIGTDDSFFQLGGDSIIAMRLVGAAREEGLSMTVADVFKNPTFADMARVVRVAGEVIDQVMSQAGGESSTAKGASGSHKPSLKLPERTASAWKDFQSIVSDQAIDDDDDGGKPLTNRVDREQSDQMFKKWQGFGSNLQSGTLPQRVPSQKRQMATPQTIHEDPSATKSVSLLGDPNVDSVISKVQVFKGGISDVLPVTDFQSLAITGTLLESKWMLNYFYLDGDGPLDLRKLNQTAFRLVQAFDILRTVFVPYGDRFLQVVLRKLQPDFLFQETDLDLDTFTEELRQKDREHGPRLGETFVQFIVAKQKKLEHYRIFMRLSHAQYDGYCLPKILSSLQAGYNGLPISSVPSFGNYVRESAKTAPGAHDHWREVLRGSKMTEIVNRYGPNYQRSAGRTITLKQMLTVPTLSHVNITTATVMKGAWASTLARIAGQSDIVFGTVISGRNGSVPNVASIIGPCLNMVPVRVVYRPEWTVLDLLGYIQDQQIANMPYESLGFREITRNCTDWPDWTNFSSVLQHNQNIHEDGATLQLAGIEYRVGAVGSQEDFADFSILSASKGGDQLEVSLTYAPNSTITEEYAQNVFDMLCATAITFAEDPYTLLPSPSELASHSSQAVSEKSCKKSAEKQPVTLPTDTGLSKHEVNTLATKLRSAWEQILRDENGNPATLELNSSFFELGGDIMGLAQVASILDQDGLRVRVEDLIDKCVFAEQVGLLAVERRKEVEKEEQSPWGEKGRRVAVKSEARTELERRESGRIGGLVRRIGLKRKGTYLK